MQGLRGLFPLASQNPGQFAQSVANRLLDPFLFQAWRAPQHMIQYVPAVAGMANTQAQPGKIIAAQVSNQITQSIMSAMPAAPFQPHDTRRQIQIIVNNQNGRSWNFVKPGQRRNGQTAAIHIGHRLKQPQFLTSQRNPTGLAMISSLGAKKPTLLASQLIDQPESGVMAGLSIFRARIAQPND
jgi:hypothetical protein